jgi:hypothetical protein
MIIQRRDGVVDCRASYCISGQDATLINDDNQDGSVFFSHYSAEVIRGLKVKSRSRESSGKRSLPESLHHADPFAIRADPGRAIADAPFVFFKTFLANHKAARTTPAEFLFLLAAMTDILAASSFSVPTWAVFCTLHDTSCCTQRL